MKAVDLAGDICKRFEGFSFTPYLCPAGVWTIGYGSIRDDQNRPICATTPAIDEPTAYRWMVAELEQSYLSAVTLSPVLRLNDYHAAAITDFIYNLGARRYRASTLRKRIDAREFSDVEAQLLRWVYGGGRKLNGLVLRRIAEAKLFYEAAAA